ncbi:MAG TPA: hypothetical protein VN829_07625 [Dongiaceae bacterium]|nr:hypothetical protein [Dongiaceae bacterium]
MSITEQEIEDSLRRAPAPKAPAGLKDRLVAQVQLAPVCRKAEASARALDPRSWLGRWWPALAPTAVSLACAMVVAVQQMEIRDLKQTIQSLSQGPTGAAAVPAEAAVRSAGAGSPSGTELREIARLQALAQRLADEVAQLEQLRAENGKLRAQIAAATSSGLSPEEEAVLADAREKAAAARCSNNLMWLGVAVRTWALDNNGLVPPSILCLSNEIGTAVLVCPSDSGRQAATNWSAITSANCSYEYLGGSGGRSDEQPPRVLFRCPVHGSIGLSDGAVQRGVAKAHPESLVQKDGKLYYQQPEAQSEEKAPPAPSRESNRNTNPNPNR